MAENIAERFHELIDTAEKLKDYKNVDVALEETRRWLKSSQADLKDARAEVAKLRTELESNKAANQQELTEHKANLQNESAKAQDLQRQKFVQMEANSKAIIAAIDMQLIAKQKELEKAKQELQATLGELEDIHLAFTDAFEVIDHARKGRQ